MGLISQLSNGTMEMLRLPSPFSAPSFPRFGYHSWYILFLTLILVDIYTKIRLEILGKVFPLFHLITSGGGRLSRVPMHAWCAFDTFEDPGRINTTCQYRRIYIAPTGLKVNASTINNLSRLNIIPSTLAVYASCRHFYLLCNTRFRWLTYLAGQDWLPVGLRKGVSLFTIRLIKSPPYGLARRNSPLYSWIFEILK